MNASAGLGAYPFYFATILPWNLIFAQFHGISWGQGRDSWHSDPYSQPNQTNMSLTLRVSQWVEDRLAEGRQSRQCWRHLKEATTAPIVFTSVVSRGIFSEWAYLPSSCRLQGVKLVFFVCLWSCYMVLLNKILETWDYPRSCFFAEQRFTQAFSCHIFPTAFFSSLDWCLLLVLLQ